MRAVLPGKPRRPAQHFPAVQTQIDRANNVLEVHRAVVRRAFHVRTGPNRTNGVVQHLRCHRTQQESPERSVPVGRHHDQVAVLAGSELHDALCGVALQHHAAHRRIVWSCTGEGLQVRGTIFRDLAGQVARAGIGHGFEGTEIRQRRYHHVKQNDFTVEVTGKGFGILHRAAAPWGELHGDENSGQTRHLGTSSGSKDENAEQENQQGQNPQCGLAVRMASVAHRTSYSSCSILPISDRNTCYFRAAAYPRPGRNLSE